MRLKNLLYPLSWLCIPLSNARSYVDSWLHASALLRVKPLKHCRNTAATHLPIVAHARSWRSFFSFLQFVVLDELHEYWGVFGSHVGLVLRRLRRVLERRFNLTPQFVGCSATIANPREHAEELTGIAPFRVVGADHDAAPRPRRKIVLYNPPRQEESSRRMPITGARLITTRMLSWNEPPKALMFARSKDQIRQLVRICKSELGETRPQHRDLVAQYTADFPARTRREIVQRTLRRVWRNE